MAQVQSLMGSLSPDVRQLLEEPLHSDILDPSEELRNLYPFQGDEEISWSEAMKLMEKLQTMDDLEKQLERARTSRGLGGVDAVKLQ